MNETQKEAFEQIEGSLYSVGFSPIQALTMGLSYYKGGYYEKLSEQEFEGVVKRFVEKYFND